MARRGTRELSGQSCPARGPTRTHPPVPKPTTANPHAPDARGSSPPTHLQVDRSLLDVLVRRRRGRAARRQPRRVGAALPAVELDREVRRDRIIEMHRLDDRRQPVGHPGAVPHGVANGEWPPRRLQRLRVEELDALAPPLDGLKLSIVLLAVAQPVVARQLLENDSLGCCRGHRSAHGSEDGRMAQRKAPAHRHTRDGRNRESRTSRRSPGCKGSRTPHAAHAQKLRPWPMRAWNAEARSLRSSSVTTACSEMASATADDAAMYRFV
eukprot:7391597-Prymnesium_polylepis.1